MKKRRILAIVMSMITLISTLGTSSVYMANTSDNKSTSSDKISEYRANLSYHDETSLDFDYSLKGESGISRNWGTLPKSYSSSAYVDWEFEKVNNYITPVKNQNPNGICWSYSTIAAAEASYIINTDITNVETVDFNEFHLVHYTYDTPADPLGLFGGDRIYLPGGDDFLQVGGSNQVTAIVLANWIGASNSTEFLASDVEGNNPDALGFEDKAHLENAYFIAMSDKTVVKEMLMKYGAVVTNYCSKTEGGNEFNGYYYCPNDDITNHAVTIVGWDDSISADSFKTTAPGNGAWLVKNSWGEDGSFGGYFWLSYYDASIADEGYVYDMVPADNYDNNYQYDGSAGLAYAEFPEAVAFANAFVADSNETLEAVGFYTFDVNMDYEIRVYKNLEANEAPQYGDLVHTQNGKEIYAGYHTVDLSSSINVSENERYAVVVTLSKENSSCCAVIDQSSNQEWIAFESYATSGESYLGNSVDSLFDINASNSEYAEGNNVRLKAYTNEVENEEEVPKEEVVATGVTLNKTEVELLKGEDATLTATVTPSDAEVKDIIWTSSNTSVATVDANGKVVAVGAGTAVITATVKGTNVSASCNVTVKEVVATGVTLNKTAVELFKGEDITLTATVSPSDAAVKDINWSSSNTAVATVDANGKVTAVAKGTAVITATVKGTNVSASCTVTVEEKVATGVVLNKTTAELYKGENVALSVTVSPSDAEVKEIIWSSSNTAVATVDANGKVTAVGKGTAVITATVKGTNVSVSCTIKVIAEEAKTGWIYENNGWYFYKDEVKQTGWLYNGGAWYYMNANGKMMTGWVNDGGTWYYMKPSGAMVTGWIQDGGVWYYMKPSGAMATGWVQDGSTWYYMKSSGAMVTGWIQDGGVWYYMKSSGAMAIGWVQDGSTWYYMKSSGAMATGWIKDGGAWYYMKSSGAMATGWVQDGNTWYYMKSSGAMATGWIQDGGTWYYMNSSGAWVR